MQTVVLILLLGCTSMSYTKVLVSDDSIVSSVISISKLPPENKQEWVHPVIFEPQERIQLTRSSYQVTTFLDFKPFLNAFRNTKGFIEDFQKDINNPEFFHELMSIIGEEDESPIKDDKTFDDFKASTYCQARPYAYSTHIKLDKFRLEVNHLYEVFNLTYCKFLTTIDHIDFHPTQVNHTHNKCSQSFQCHEYYKGAPHTLREHEEKFLDAFLEAMYEINSELHSELRHVKHFGLMTWILGWGVISNAQSINKIKKNLRVLQDQNVLQDHQIKALAKHLNLTITQVNRHEKMLYELDSKLLILNHTIQDIMVQLSYFRYEYTIMTHIQMRINRIYTSIFALKEDVDTLYEYM